MCTYVRTRVVLLLMLTACAAGSMGGCHPYDPGMWAIFEITGLSADPNEGLSVFALGGRFGNEEREIAAPGTEGRTYFPYWGPSGAPGHLRIVASGKTIELDFLLEDDALAERDGVTVRVIDADAAPPPAPTITVVPGSSPPVFVIDGYIRNFGICDCAKSREAWSVSAPTTAGAYVHSLEFGTVPAGWRDFGTSRCGDVEYSAFPCAGGFRPVAWLPFSNETVVGDTYCLDAEGAVASCADAD